MEKIIQIQYQGRNFSIEESAYQLFQEYESELKNYFSKEEAGEEIFADLQYRMAEILEQRSLTNTLYRNDIEDLIETIGRPADFNPEGERTSEAKENPFSDIKKKLFRDKKDKIVAGVCSGIANYFAIDPIIVRLIFVLFTLFNIVTLLSFNVGLLAYIIFWIILRPAVLKPNVSKKLFRNPKDKILGGVCSGIAQFFNIDTWIVRLIFLAPILLGFLSSHSNFSFVNIEMISHSFYSLSVMSYFLLWFIIPVAKVTTDYMLMKGEPININTIQNSTSMQDISNNNRNGLNKFFKVIAYIIIALVIIVMVPTAIGIVVAFLYSYNIAEIVLFSSSNKILALLSLLLFVALPAIGLVIWFIRSVLGYKANKSLRAVFIGLNILGWISITLLAVAMARQNSSPGVVSHKVTIDPAVDTLYIRSTDTSALYNEEVYFDLNDMNFLVEKTAGYNHIRAVDIDYEESEDSTMYAEIKIISRGENKGLAHKHAQDVQFKYELDSNVLRLPAQVTVNNAEPYYMQNAEVTIYVPKGKTVITDKKYLRQISKSFHSSGNGVYIEHHGRNVDEDRVFTYENETRHEADEKESDLQEALERKKEMEREHADRIREKEQELKEERERLEQERKTQDKEIEEMRKANKAG